MANDVPDWTTQNSVQVVGQSPAKTPLGDLSAAALEKDRATEQISGVAVASSAIVLASFKAAAGALITQVGALGAYTKGTSATVTPPFGQATVAAHLLVAWVTATNGEPNTVTAGWTKVLSKLQSGRWVALWVKINSAGADANPVFTSAAGTEPMFAQVGEFAGVAVAAPTDQTSSAGQASVSTTITVANSNTDAAVGDLICTASFWAKGAGLGITVTDTFNNGATAVRVGGPPVVEAAIAAIFNYAIIPPAVVSVPFGVQIWPYDAFGLSAPATGTQATVTLAASPTKAYTCAVIVGALSSTTAVVSGVRELILQDGASSLFRTILSTQALAGAVDRFGLSDLAYKGTINTAMTLSLDVGVANIAERVSMACYLR